MDFTSLVLEPRCYQQHSPLESSSDTGTKRGCRSRKTANSFRCNFSRDIRILYRTLVHRTSTFPRQRSTRESDSRQLPRHRRPSTQQPHTTGRVSAEIKETRPGGRPRGWAAKSQGRDGGARPWSGQDQAGTSVVGLCGSWYFGGPQKRLNPAPHPLFDINSVSVKNPSGKSTWKCIEACVSATNSHWFAAVVVPASRRYSSACTTDTAAASPARYLCLVAPAPSAARYSCIATARLQPQPGPLCAS
ncbi:hypothetical protein LIA77_01636 [Sarocladium implicatum]|nr:hypothetical protein LIA77_01636 [Sarocladium implicatum]